MSESKSPAAVNPQLVRFHGMQYVQTNYYVSGLSDTEFAFKMTEALGHPYSTAQVREWRRVFNIANNKVPGNAAKAMVNLRATQLERMISGWPGDSAKWVTISPVDYSTLLEAVQQIKELTK